MTAWILRTGTAAQDPVPIRAGFFLFFFFLRGGFFRERRRAGGRAILQPFSGTERLTDRDAIVRTGDRIPDGKFAFVTMLDGRSRAWPAIGSRLEDSDHPALASFSQRVLFAGEIWFQSGRIVRWNNKSGAYAPDAALRHQAGLPLERFEPFLG